MGILNKASGMLAGVGIGGAAGAGAEPVLEVAKQNAWFRRRNKVADPLLAAQAAAQGFESEAHFRSLDEKGNVVAHSEWGATAVDLLDDTRRHGWSDQRWNLFRRLSQAVPPYAEALTLWRRGRVDEATVDAVLAKEGIPAGLWPALKELAGERLDAATLANAVQQGFVPDAGLLPGDVSGPPFDPPAEQAPIPTLKEFAASGIDKDRAGVMADLAGNPPSPEQLAEMVLRGEITAKTFYRGLREGRTKTKWSSALLYYLTHPLLTPGVLVARYLKGWDDQATFHERMALHGFTGAQADDWYEAEGRPAAPGQMWSAWARGVAGPNGNAMDEDQFLRGIRESDVRPEWGKMLWGIRFTYPPLFQIGRLVQAKAIDADTAAEWARKNRLAPEVVTALKAYWSKSSPAAADPHVTKAQNQLWTRTHSSYVLGDATEAEASAKLAALGVAADARPTVLALWNQERTLTRKELTAAQLKKAYQKLVVNPATGQPWTRDEVIGELVTRGYTLADAQTYVDTPSGK